MALHSLRIIALIVFASAGLTACASAGGSDTIDGSITGLPDADPNAPDADPNAPDADPGAPDANVSMPDAMVNNAPDAASTCPKTPCHLVDQCGCASPLVCDLDYTNGTTLAAGDTRCRAVIEPGTEAKECTSADQCAGGYMCIGSQCRKWCDEANDLCPGAGGKCLVVINYEGTAIPGAVTCTKDCVPTDLAPSGCPTGFGCHISVAPGDVIVTDCAKSVGAGGDGASCATNGHTDCQTGYDCVTVGTTPVCKQNCIVSGGSGPACAVGTCSGFSPPATVGGVTYGLCN